MANQPPMKKRNPKPGVAFKEISPEMKATATATVKKDNQYEFCKVCKINHNLGRRHNYFPNHVKSLSAFLSRFQSKLSDVKLFVRNPSRPELASRNRLWCVFCDVDIDEVGSSFACDNAINHLASVDHLRNVKGFLWKYGGGMDRVDSFRVSEADLAKYQEKCISLKREVAAEQSSGPVVGPSNDIHNKVNLEYTNFDPNSIISFNSIFPEGVLPLQNYTNEKIQVSSSDHPRVPAVGTCLHDDKSYFHANTSARASNNITGYVDSQLSTVSEFWKSSADGFSMNGLVQQVYSDERTANGESSSVGLPILTQISSTARDGAAGNVHSGAPPPWLDTTVGDMLGDRTKLSVTKSRKSKLNPNRVGAAWAEKRKIEMEMEKRGELPHNSYNSNWLPNFGGVWQSGSRKESQKEFEVEGKRPFQEESQPEIPVHIQPYISKRMRQNTSV